MDKEKLALLHSAINSSNGQQIINYLIDKMIDYSSGLANAEQIKGMGLLIHDLKDVERQFHKEQQRRSK